MYVSACTRAHQGNVSCVGKKRALFTTETPLAYCMRKSIYMQKASHFKSMDSVTSPSRVKYQLGSSLV